MTMDLKIRPWLWILLAIIIIMVIGFFSYFLYQNSLNPSARPTPIKPPTASPSLNLTLPEPSSPASNLDEIPLSWKTCQQDNDCAETQATCCNCNSGGTQSAINIKYLSLWQAKVTTTCFGLACPTLYACQEGRTVCQNNQCQFVRS